MAAERCYWQALARQGGECQVRTPELALVLLASSSSQRCSALGER